MTICRQILCCCLLLLMHPLAKAQTYKIDSIKHLLSKISGNDAASLQQVFALCGQYNSLHPDSLFIYVQQAKKLAAAAKNFTDEVQAAHYELVCFSKMGKLDTALTIVDKRLADPKLLSMPVLANKLRLNRTSILVRQNKLKEALENALVILHDAEKNNLVEEQVKAQIQIGWVYMELNQYNDALKWFFTARATNLKRQGQPEPAVMNSDIAAVYNSLKKNDSATIFVELAMQQAEADQDLSFLCNALYIYADICIDEGNSKKAEALLKQGLDIRKKIGDPFYIVSDIAQLGKFYATTSQYTKGIETINEGIAIAKQNHINSKLLFLYTTLADNYKAAGDLTNYGNTLNTIISLKDTLYNLNSAEAVSALQTKYEVQKKENTIIQQRFDLAQRSYWIYGSVCLLLFGLVLWYINLKNNQRKQAQRMALAVSEEKRLSEKAIAVAQEKERKRIAADLHDNLGAFAAAISSNVDHISASQKDITELKVYEELKANSQSMVSQLNDTIWVLTKEILALTAISDRLKVFIQRLHNSYPSIQIDVTEKINTDHLLAPIQAFHLFNILQEAIINALKHSRCSEIMITIASDINWMIAVADNGAGFQPTENMSNGNGLTNMKNRTKEAGWQISWDKNRPQGTVVIIKNNQQPG